MQVIIPMSGFGERFRAAGYVVPKPLIKVEGKLERFEDHEDGLQSTDFTFLATSQ